jgi:hypothetical protein
VTAEDKCSVRVSVITLPGEVAVDIEIALEVGREQMYLRESV